MPSDDHHISLVSGEAITSALPLDLDTNQPTDSQLDSRYVSDEVRIVVEQARYPLKQIPEIVRSADYNLQPDFQRRPRWTRDKQSRLMESLVMNVPIPPIFLYESEFSRYEVMDGRQRLTAITEYYSDAFPLEGLIEWPELNGRKYSELPEQVRRGIDRRFLSAILLLHETAKSDDQATRMKQLVFERINTGGEDLSNQEKRNALFPGPMNSLCIELARTSSLCNMWQIPPPASDEDLTNPDWTPPPELATNDLFRTMQDAELVLRFFAHRQRLTLWRGGMRLDDYLTTYLRAANLFPTTVIDELRSVFVRTSDLTFEVLGDGAFSLLRPRSGGFVWVKRPTLIAYDPIMAAFSSLLDAADALRTSAKQIKDDLGSFYRDHVEDFDGRKTNLSDIRNRDEAFFALLKKYV